MILVRSLAFTDLLSLELMESKALNNASPGSICDFRLSVRKSKRSKTQYSPIEFRPPHVLELPNGYYLLTSCDLKAIPEEEAVAIPINSQLYCRSGL